MNDRLDTRFESGDAETIGGLVVSRLGRVPEVGARIDTTGYVIRVEAVDDTRIERLVIQAARALQETDDEWTTDRSGRRRNGASATRTTVLRSV